MANDNLAPRDAKIISIILRSLGIDECEPKVIVQLLEFAYKYACDILEDALLYAKYAERGTIVGKDVKLALQTKVGKHFLPAPPRNFLSSSADVINNMPMTLPDSDNMLRVPSFRSGLFGMEYQPEEKDSQAKKRKVH